jgi:hypothetical protein
MPKERNVFRHALSKIKACLWVLLCGSLLFAQKPATHLLFHGARVNISADESQFPPATPAVLCIALTPIEQCYTPPKSDVVDLPYAFNPTAKIVQLKPGFDAILFEVEATGGGSGSGHLLALLVPGKGKDLNNLLPDVSFGDQSEHHFWKLPSISDMQVLVLAEGMGDLNGSHFSRQRFLIKVLVFNHHVGFYGLQDEYLTSKKYPSLDEVDVIHVLEAERKEILARLKKQY